MVVFPLFECKVCKMRICDDENAVGDLKHAQVCICYTRATTLTRPLIQSFSVVEAVAFNYRTDGLNKSGLLCAFIHE